MKLLTALEVAIEIFTNSRRQDRYCNLQFCKIVKHCFLVTNQLTNITRKFAICYSLRCLAGNIKNMLQCEQSSQRNLSY